MAIAMIPGIVRKVITPPDKELPEEKQTKFHLKSLTYAEAAPLRKHQKMFLIVSDKIEAAEKSGDSMVDLTFSDEFIADTLGVNGKPKALVGWENFKDEDGNLIAFNSDGFLDNVGLLDRIFLSMDVFSSTILSEKDSKNSISGPLLAHGKASLTA